MNREPPGPPGHSYADPAVQALLDGPGHPGRDVPRSRQVFVNRTLRMDRIEAVGFDMDYTLALYRLGPVEGLAFTLTRDRMVERLGYPEAVRHIRYDPDFVIRGLVMDKQTGNLFKMDRHNHVGRCFHGTRPLPPDEIRRLYREEKIRLSSPRFAWLDTLFSLPEACLFAGVVDVLAEDGRPATWEKLYDDIRSTIDTVHADGSLKALVRADLDHFVIRDPGLGPALHKLRSGGKRLFLLTNSAWDYTDAVMRHVLDGVLPEYPSWRNYFDFAVTAARKPGFFSEKRPIEALGPDGAVLGEAKALERNVLYQGGSLAELERELAWLGDKVPELEEMARLEELRARLGDELSARRSALNGAERRLERGSPGPDERARLEEERRRTKVELELLRRAHRDADARIASLSEMVEGGFNRFWGLTFKEGHENSRFGEQIEDYACIYTSRVANLVFYSPMEYYRSPRNLMPHERAGLALAPFGDEHAVPRAAARPSKAAKP